MEQQSKKTRTGLLFGSFNPVHTGHLIIADHFLQNTDLDQIWFVLSPQNPLKSGKGMLEEGERLNMLKAAIEGNPGFHLCDIELGMERPSYTVTTMELLGKRHPEMEFTLIIGSDNLEELDRWKDYDKLLERHTIYVYKRSEKVSSPYSSRPNVFLFDSPLLNISSSMIRDLVARGKKPRYLVPTSVLEIIDGRGLYRK